MNRTLSSYFKRALESTGISHRPLCYLAFAGISCRLFTLLVVDLPETLYASWIASLLGAFLALPAVFSIYLLLKKNTNDLSSVLISVFGKKLFASFCILFFLFLIVDASSVFVTLSASASYSALFAIPEWALSLLSFLTVSCVVLRGGNSVSGIASICLYAFPFLYAWILVLQKDYLNFHYLTPILGPGGTQLFRCAWHCAGEYCLIPLIFLIDDRRIVTGKNQYCPAPPRSIFTLFGCTALAVTVLCALHDAMYPCLPDLSDNRYVRLDLLLSIGKSDRSVQLPMLLLWFAFLAVCASFLLYLSTRLLSVSLGLPSGVTGIISSASAFLFTFVNGKYLSRLSTAFLPVFLTAVLFSGWAFSSFRKRYTDKAQKGSRI